MPHARPILGAVLTAAALAAAGCGSSSSDDDATAKAPASTTAAKAPATTTPATPAAATGPRPTKAAYVRRADAVCREAHEVSASANSVVQKAFQSGNGTAAAEAIENYTPLFTKHMEELKALRRPKGKTKVLNGLLKVMDGQVQALRDEAAALRQDDTAALQTIAQTQQQEVQFADALGRQYGFKVCGRSS